MNVKIYYVSAWNNKIIDRNFQLVNLKPKEGKLLQHDLIINF